MMGEFRTQEREAEREQKPGPGAFAFAERGEEGNVPFRAFFFVSEVTLRNEKYKYWK